MNNLNDPMTAEQIGAKIEILRIANGFSIEEFAKKVRLSPESYTKIEAGRGQLGPAVLLRILRALNTNSSEFYDESASFIITNSESENTTLDGVKDGIGQSVGNVHLSFNVTNTVHDKEIKLLKDTIQKFQQILDNFMQEVVSSKQEISKSNQKISQLESQLVDLKNQLENK